MLLHYYISSLKKNFFSSIFIIIFASSFVFKINADVAAKMTIREFHNTSILFACSILGKFAINNDKAYRKVNKVITELVNIHDYELDQAYNIANLLLLRNCIKSLNAYDALLIIQPDFEPTRKNLTHLNIIGTISEYEKYKNKDMLLDELNDINKRLVALTNDLKLLKEESKIRIQEEKRRYENEKRKTEEERILYERFSKGIEFRDENDPSKLITVKPNDPNALDSDINPLDYSLTELQKEHKRIMEQRKKHTGYEEDSQFTTDNKELRKYQKLINQYKINTSSDTSENTVFDKLKVLLINMFYIAPEYFIAFALLIIVVILLKCRKVRRKLVKKKQLDSIIK